MKHWTDYGLDVAREAARSTNVLTFRPRPFFFLIKTLVPQLFDQAQEHVRPDRSGVTFNVFSKLSARVRHVYLLKHDAGFGCIEAQADYKKFRPIHARLTEM